MEWGGVTPLRTKTIRLLEGDLFRRECAWSADCHLNGADRKLIVERRPDDLDDPRLRPALTKTLPHPVPIGPRLANVLHNFIVNHRPSYPGAKRSPTKAKGWEGRSHPTSTTWPGISISVRSPSTPK
jgi:hypothetical protein